MAGGSPDICRGECEGWCGRSRNYLRDDRGDLRATESDGRRKDLLYLAPVSRRGGDLEKDLTPDIFHQSWMAKLPDKDHDEEAVKYYVNNLLPLAVLHLITTDSHNSAMSKDPVWYFL